VLRKRLELIGAESPQLTTSVRFAPGSIFPADVHHGGEELLVLKGTFSDDRGDYPAGTYVRNPPP
jgi:anti-sigma factor ChrR (cupin superfamily)